MKIYIVDGSENCFFTAVFIAYNKRDCIITEEQNLQLGFGNHIEEVETDDEKCERVKNKLNEYDNLAVEEICLLLRSC